MRDAWPHLLRDGVLGDEVLGEAFDVALGELRERLGDDGSDWRWGDLHRVVLAHPLAAIPGFEALFVALEAGVGGDDQTVLQTGVDARGGGFPAAVIPSWRAVYDLADLDRSVGVLPAGNSGNPASAHWNDQAPLWLAGETHPLPFTPAAVEAAIGRRGAARAGYHLGLRCRFPRDDRRSARRATGPRPSRRRSAIARARAGTGRCSSA